MEKENEELYWHIRSVALQHSWVTLERDNTYLWEIAVVLWLKQHRPGLLAREGLPDAGSIQMALCECDTLALYGPKRLSIQQIAWAALDYDEIRKRYVQERKKLIGLTRPELEIFAQDNDVPFNKDMLEEELLEAIVEHFAPLNRITEQCRALGIQIDEYGMVPTQNLPDEMRN